MEGIMVSLPNISSPNKDLCQVDLPVLSMMKCHLVDHPYLPNISSPNKDLCPVDLPVLSMMKCRLVDHPYLHPYQHYNTQIIRRHFRHHQHRMLLEGIHSSHLDGNGIHGFWRLSVLFRYLYQQYGYYLEW